jgi:hypothetical protein
MRRTRPFPQSAKGPGVDVPGLRSAAVDGPTVIMDHCLRSSTPGTSARCPGSASTPSASPPRAAGVNGSAVPSPCRGSLPPSCPEYDRSRRPRLPPGVATACRGQPDSCNGGRMARQRQDHPQVHRRAPHHTPRAAPYPSNVSRTEKRPKRTCGRFLAHASDRGVQTYDLKASLIFSRPA